MNLPKETPMIEKCAKALYEEDDPWSRAWEWPNLNPECQGSADAYRRLARAVIEALMEPTPGMLDQGGAKLESAPFVSPHAIWQAMITAALNEGEG